MAQFGSALASGARGRGFKSRRLDHIAKQALFACLAFLLRKTHKKTKRRFGGCLADFFLRDVEFCDASGAFLPRCSVAAAPCKFRRLDQRRNSTVLQRECVFTHSLCFFKKFPALFYFFDDNDIIKRRDK